MPEFDSIAALFAYLESAVQEGLAGDVLDAVRKEEAKQVQTTVYDAYEPTSYRRRYDMGNRENIVGNVSGTTLSVTNITPPSSQGWPPPTVSKDLAQVVETGVGYDYFSPGARPFTQKTGEALAANKAHVKALRSALRKRGIKVR